MGGIVDVVVVGAGLAGCSVAAHLDGARVVVLERGAQRGAEATSQNAGMIRRLGEDPWERALALRSSEKLAALGDDVSRRVGAVLGLVHDATWLNDGVAHLRARGVRVEASDRPEEVAPALAGARLARAWV